MPDSTANFQDIISVLDGVKGPSSRGWYSAKCPAHDDRHASLGFIDGAKGIAFKCQSGCKRADIVRAIEQSLGKKIGRKNHEKPKPEDVTLAALAKKCCLSALYLNTIYGFADVPSPFGSTTVVQVPYLNDQFKLVGMKYRVSLNRKPKYLWDTGKFPKTEDAPFGLPQLLQVQRLCEGADLSTIVLCEGETDQAVLHANSVPALGISGASSWRPEFANIPLIRDAKTLLVVQEPGDAGEKFVKAISDTFSYQTGKVIPVKFKLPLKDPCELWANNPKPDAFLAELNKLLTEAEAEAEDNLIPFTHTGNAERLVKKFGGDFRWLQDADEFRTWDGELWEPSRNGDGKLLAYTKEVARSIADEEWARASESQNHRLAMIRLTKGEEKVFGKRAEFNCRPMLLNVANGCLDLEKRDLREFRREDFLTFKSPVVYDPFAICPKFDEFMDFTFGGDKDLIHFIEKAMGYTLTSDTSEQCFFLCHGNGGNGKSQLLELLRFVLGPNMAVAAKFDTFLENRFNDSTTQYQLALFAGARLVTGVEPNASGRFNESLLKELTGSDPINARPIYGHPFNYRPAFKLWLAMNNVPKMTGTDEGIWRRVRYIPFNQTVPPERKVKDYARKLFDEEGSGILNRLLQGLSAWQEEGLNPPGVVIDATAKFRETQDTFGRFIAEKCVVAPNAFVKCSELYDSYELWAESQNEYVMSAIAVARELDRREFAKRRRQHNGQDQECRIGIGLAAT